MNKKIISILIITILAMIAFANPVSANIANREYSTRYYVGDIIEINTTNYAKFGYTYENAIRAYTGCKYFTVVESGYYPTYPESVYYTKFKATAGGYGYHSERLNDHAWIIHKINIQER
jgi:hypothetical protein